MILCRPHTMWYKFNDENKDDDDDDDNYGGQVPFSIYKYISYC